jgi:DNA-binding transcriptional ArsR family regulator/protein-L-isoaspartate O-methyltransferase
VYIYIGVTVNTPPSSQRWELYRVLSEPIRLRLLALALEEELAVGELAELLGESQPNVSRHAASLKQAGLLDVRRHGTRALLRTNDEAKGDPVVADAIASGRALCAADGSLSKIAEVLRARDSAAREFFSRPGAAGAVQALPTELGLYLAALGQLLPHRSLAIDAGTGDGGMLDVLAPVFDRVVAVDRSEAQLARARERAAHRGYSNVEFVEGELDDAEVVRAAGQGADAVFAVRVLHHAARPAQIVERLADLCRPGGTLVVLDYAPHEDEAMREQADLWLGFEPAELVRFARSARLADARVVPLPRAMNGGGPDAHLAFQLLFARKDETLSSTKDRPSRGALHTRRRSASMANGMASPAAPSTSRKATNHG